MASAVTVGRRCVKHPALHSLEDDGIPSLKEILFRP